MRTLDVGVQRRGQRLLVIVDFDLGSCTVVGEPHEMPHIVGFVEASGWGEHPGTADSDEYSASVYLRKRIERFRRCVRLTRLDPATGRASFRTFWEITK